MTIERFNRKLDENTARMLRYEDRGAIKMFRLLEETRSELATKLARHTTRGNTYSIDFYTAMINDIDAILGTMKDRATGLVRQELESSFIHGQVASFGEMAIFETGLGILTPRVSTAVLDIIINERTDFIEKLTDSVRNQMVNELRRQGAIDNANNTSNAIAVSEDTLQATVQGVQRSLAKGFASGDGTAALVRRLTHPEQGTFNRLTRASAVRTVRIGINDTYNEGRDESIRRASERLPHIKRAWVSALQDSTPICLHLHGQKCGVGQAFQYGGWHGARPPAIGAGATPSFHLCRSCVVPYSERWPNNPRLEPLSAEDIKHFETKGTKPGGRFRKEDVVRPGSAKDTTTPRAVAKKKGRPAGSKNKPKPTAETIAPPSVPVKETFADSFKKKYDGSKRDEATLVKAGAELNAEITQRANAKTAPARKALEKMRTAERTARGIMDSEAYNVARIEERAVMRKNWIKASGKRSTLERRIGKIEREETLNALKEIRPFGGKLNVSARGAGKTVQEATNVYPTAWVQASNARGPMVAKTVKRGYYSDAGTGGEATIALSGNDEAAYSVAVHELGHRMEYAVPGLREAERAFIERRAVNLGEQPIPIPGYTRPEPAYKDNFFNHYVGKVYGGPHNTMGNYGGREAYEVTSMGLEALWADRYKLTDEDHKNLMLGMLGVL